MITINISETGLGKFSNFFVVVLTMMMGALIELFLVQISPILAVVCALSITGIIVWQKWVKIF